MVQCVNGVARRLLLRLSSQAPARQHVVEQNQAVLPDSRQNQFIVGVVFRFGRVNEREVEGQAGFEPLQRRDRWAEAKLDAVLDTGLRPITLRYARPFLAFVNAYKPSAARQRARDA